MPIRAAPPIAKTALTSCALAFPAEAEWGAASSPSGWGDAFGGRGGRPGTKSSTTGYEGRGCSGGGSSSGACCCCGCGAPGALWGACWGGEWGPTPLAESTETAAAAAKETAFRVGPEELGVQSGNSSAKSARMSSSMLPVKSAICGADETPPSMREKARRRGENHVVNRC